MLRSDLCNFSDAYKFMKGVITVTEPENETKALHLKIMHHLSTAFQKWMAYKLTM